MREATEQEKVQIVENLIQRGHEPIEAHCFVGAAHIGVIDNYMPDTPGYCGKVLIVLWSGGHDLIETFTVKGDRLASDWDIDIRPLPSPAELQRMHQEHGGAAGAFPNCPLCEGGAL